VKRSVALAVAVLVSAACLFALHRSGTLHWATLAPILLEHGWLLVGTGACQVVLTFVAVWRYQLLLRRLGANLPFHTLVGPTVVAQAIGVWLPASMAVMEAVRLGLMLRLTRGATGTAPSDMRARVAIASLLDRLVGQATMLFVGGACGLTLAARGGPLVKLPAVLASLAAVSMAGGGALLLLPSVSRSQIVARLLAAVSTHGSKPGLGALARGSALVQRLLDGVALLRGQRGWFLIPSLLSTGILSLAALALYLPGLATAAPPAYVAFFIGIPLVQLAQLLPLGFAGLGTQQLLTVGMLAPLATDAASVAAASFAQNAISLVSTTLLGAGASVFLAQDLAELRRATR
jgi:hypothetical protein